MANNVNQSKTYRIYIKPTKEWVEVPEEYYRGHTNYWEVFRKKVHTTVSVPARRTSSGSVTATATTANFIVLKRCCPSIFKKRTRTTIQCLRWMRFLTPHLTDEEIQLHFLSAANKLLATKAAIIANDREMQALMFDTTELEAEQAQLLEKTQMISDMVQKVI